MGKTDIEWADKVWNPVTGCTKISEGCRNCYAERIARRFWGERKFSDVWCHGDRLEQPLHWMERQFVFVNSMSDLFHEDVSDKFIRSVFESMWIANWHTYLILTKRPERMRDWVTNFWQPIYNGLAFEEMFKKVWLGVSVEDQKTADERIPILLRIPAAKRFVSVEPMLGEIDLTHDLDGYRSDDTYGEHLDWVICGGETGPGARPMHPDWVRSLMDQCQAAGVPLWFKSWGCHIPTLSGSPIMRYTSKAKSHNLLDGRKWEERPE